MGKQLRRKPVLINVEFQDWFTWRLISGPAGDVVGILIGHSANRARADWPCFPVPTVSIVFVSSPPPFRFAPFQSPPFGPLLLGVQPRRLLFFTIPSSLLLEQSADSWSSCASSKGFRRKKSVGSKIMYYRPSARPLNHALFTLLLKFYFGPPATPAGPPPHCFFLYILTRVPLRLVHAARISDYACSFDGSVIKD